MSIGQNLPVSLPRWFRAGQIASQAIVDRFYQKPSTTSIFHYTSTKALISIVQNNELWLSDATFLNDSAEIEHGRLIAREQLQAAANRTEELEPRAMMEATLELFDRRVEPAVYVACFSMEADDLAQWRGYGKGATPVGIEFVAKPLMFGYASEAILQRVFYDLEEQNWIFEQVLRTYLDAYPEDVRNPKPSPRSEPIPIAEERAMCARKLYHDLWRYIVACKDSTFSAEHEVRYTYIAHDFSDSGRDWYPEHPSPMFRESDGRIIPYLSSKNLNFQNLPRVGEIPLLPIRSVRVGPVSDQMVILRSVRKLLDVSGHATVEITKTKSTLRP